MKYSEAIEILECHNRWRRGEDIEQTCPTELGIAIEIICKNKNNMQSLEKLNELVIEWAKEKGILEKATPLTQMSKTLEEVEETRDALMMKANGVIQYRNAVGKEKNTREEIKDGYGDILVTVLIGIEMQGLTTSECLEHAYNVISKRKGEMIDGKFVKDGSTGN